MFVVALTWRLNTWRIYWESVSEDSTFICDTGNVYISPDLSTSYDHLEKQDDGSYILTRKNQQKYYFNQSGMLENVTNRTGQLLVLGYDPTGKLDTITKPISGQNVYLSYNFKTLDLALQATPGSRPMIHSDRGFQYTS